MKLNDLPNIGTHAADLLVQAGIETPDEFMALGAEEAWLRVRTIDSGACLHMLYGFEGAVQGIPKSTLDPARKAALKAFFNAEQ